MAEPSPGALEAQDGPLLQGSSLSGTWRSSGPAAGAFDGPWWAGAGTTVSGGILCTASVLLLPAGLAGSLMTLGDEPLHGLLDFIGRAILAAVLVAGPAGGLAIGCWLVRRGAGAVGWRAAAALAVYAAVLTAPLVFHRPWLLQFFIALVYGADVGVANRLVWQRWGAPGAAFTACFAVAFVTAVFHFV